MPNIIKKMCNQFSDDNNLKIIQTICDIYNKKLYKYTNSFVGRISKPKNATDIPKQYMSISEYIDSNAQWKRILDFHSRIVEEQVDINDYFDIMIKNWANISYAYNIKGHNRPIFATLISKYGISTYKKYKKMEERDLLINRGRIETKEENVPIMPTLQADINSLFRLKNINTEMSYTDIIDTFVGEFSNQFKNIIHNMKEENITEENLGKICGTIKNTESNKQKKESNRISGKLADMKENKLISL